MQANISYQITSGTGSKADGDGKISAQWLMFVAIALLTTVALLFAAWFDPGLLPLEPLIGP